MFPHALLLFNVGSGEALFIIFLFILLFGAHRIPELARALGRAQREFQKARDEVQREVEKEATTPAKGTPAAAPAVPPIDDERVRVAARDLGIPVEGRTTAELKAAIAERLGTGPATSG